jgi:hypothetical protein
MMMVETGGHIHMDIKDMCMVDLFSLYESALRSTDLHHLDDNFLYSLLLLENLLVSDSTTKIRT